MPSDETITKRKSACQNCTKAKAKCSPFESRQDACYRCHRLNKECVFDDVMRKRGPKARSRVKALEQRVESLIEILAANGQSVNSISVLPTRDHPDSIPEDVPNATENADHASARPNTVATSPVDSLSAHIDTPETQSTEPGVSVFDPVSAAYLTEDRAAALLKRFQDEFVWSFPFVVVSGNVKDVRKQQPFLFHAVMTTMTYETPLLQHTLAEEFKNQISSRIILQSHKSLEILQGLLVFTAWYHFSYRVQNQQLAIIIHLCIALVQDLGLNKNPKDKVRGVPLSKEDCGVIFKGDRSNAEKRAFLGTYYVAVAFAQAWRKPTTLQYTRYMAQCCKSVTESREVNSDILVSPLVKLSNLVSRVNDYFSYDDIDNAEVKGEAMLESSSLTFQSELAQIKENIPDDLKHNDTLKLKCFLVDIWLYESSLHNSLWNQRASNTHASFPATRLKMLYRTMNAVKAYLNAMLAIDQDSFYNLAFPAWSGWFYTIIVACKLVFLQEHGKQDYTGPEDVQQALGLIIHDSDGLKQVDLQRPSSSSRYVLSSTTSSWDPMMVEKEAEFLSLFEKFLEKMDFTTPLDEWFDKADKFAHKKDDHACSPLFSIACLQRGLLHGFQKRLSEYARLRVASSPNPSDVPNSGTASDLHRSGPTPNTLLHPVLLDNPGLTPYEQARAADPHPIPFIGHLNFGMTNFDTLPEAPVPTVYDQYAYQDWAWDAMMEDFTLPPL
ncbi:hypothetical protein BDV96DRAFT_343251 [Lophiotrema nucula]|uniref:Zn(2)-C6 fungal-type domain-containing protein n=1 Tax=Lophiotrema nucula TaxID=690887 RepID=A0A6A5ZIJ7_9PLEO|nr:hypothetical protein BDV96DRAFT_343251 [Lophiotrema nucula]